MQSEDGKKRLLREDLCSGSRSNPTTPTETQLIRSLSAEFEDLALNVVEDLKELSDRTGMPIKQESGERSYGPPRDWTGPPPPKGAEVFIGKLPRQIYETHLVPLLEDIGPIYELRLKIDFGGQNRGFCFAQFTKTEDAEKAIAALNNYEIAPGRRIGVVKSTNNTRLYMSGIPYGKTEAEIYEEIDKITEGITKVILPSPADSSDSSKKNRGFAFIEYETHKAACLARRKLLPHLTRIFHREVSIDWALEGSDARSLHLQNVHPRTSPAKLTTIFNRASNQGVVNLKMCNGYSFVHFASREQAVMAKNELDGKLLDGSAIKINWMKPKFKYAKDFSRSRAYRSNKYETPRTCQKKVQSRAPPSSEKHFEVPAAPIPQPQEADKKKLSTRRKNVPPPINCQQYYEPRYADPHLHAYGYSRQQVSIPSLNPPYVVDPVQNLIRYCTMNGWGEPMFFPCMYTCGNAIGYTGIIYLNTHPTGPKEFQLQSTYSSVDEAKWAASIGLFQLLQNDSNEVYFTFPPPVSQPQYYPHATYINQKGH